MSQGSRRRRLLVSLVAVLAILVVAFLLLREPAPPSRALGALPPPLNPAEADRGGVGLAVQNHDPGLQETGARWYFNWSHRPHDDIDLEFVPLVCGYPGDQQVSKEHLDEVEEALRQHPTDYPDGTIFLVGNEIGYEHQQDGRSAQEYAEDFHRCHEMLTSVNRTFEVSVGPTILTPDESITDAIVGADDGLDYLDQVLDAYQEQHGTPIPATHVAATNHVLEAGALEVFTERIVELRRLLAEHGLHDRGVLLTEIGVPTRGSEPEQIEAFLRDALDFVATASDAELGHPDDGRLVQRWAWFMAQPLSPWDKLTTTGVGAFFLRFAQTSLFDRDGDLTHLGEVYTTMMTATD